jgi:hypothetical protein
VNSTFAQAPEGFSFQSVVRNAGNNLIVSASVGLRISVLQGSANGTAVYVETHTTITNANGLASVQVGNGAVQSGVFTTINWGAGPYFIKVETAPAGGTLYTISGTQQLLSVPYALFAKSTAAPSIPLGTNQGDQLTWNGTQWVVTPACELFTYYYRDADGDGFGNPFHPVNGCAPVPGFVANNGDCDDADSGTSPNRLWFLDADNDGFGRLNATTASCTQPEGYSAFSSDCNDNNPNINPLAEELCNTIDDDCDGTVDEGALGTNDNCQFCGNVCQFPNATAGCAQGLCMIILCDGGFGDCNGIAADGCETPLDINLNHCGTCGNQCNLPHANSSCVLSQCEVASCQSGFFNFDGLSANGCEVNLSTHCVISGQVIANGTSNPAQSCLKCNTSLNSFGWSAATNGTVCAGGGVCSAGVCFQ